MSDPSKLFGVQGFRSNNGEITAREWAELRCMPDHSGFMEGSKNSIIWFLDPTARGEFINIFGGIAVTLHRKPDGNAAEQAALNARLAASFGGGV